MSIDTDWTQYSQYFGLFERDRDSPRREFLFYEVNNAHIDMRINE